MDSELAINEYVNRIQQLELELFLSRVQNALHIKGIYGAIEYVQSLTVPEHLSQAKSEMLERLQKAAVENEERLQEHKDRQEYLEQLIFATHNPPAPPKTEG